MSDDPHRIFIEFQPLDELRQIVVSYFESRKDDYPNFHPGLLKDGVHSSGDAPVLDLYGRTVPTLVMDVNGTSSMPATVADCRGTSLLIVAAHEPPGARLRMPDQTHAPLLHLRPIGDTWCVAQLREPGDLARMLDRIFESPLPPWSVVSSAQHRALVEERVPPLVAGLADRLAEGFVESLRGAAPMPWRASAPAVEQATPLLDAIASGQYTAEAVADRVAREVRKRVLEAIRGGVAKKRQRGGE